MRRVSQNECIASVQKMSSQAIEWRSEPGQSTKKKTLYFRSVSPAALTFGLMPIVLSGVLLAESLTNTFVYEHKNCPRVPPQTDFCATSNVHDVVALAVAYAISNFFSRIIPQG